MSMCQACGGVIGRDCFNPQECMEITQHQAMCYREMVAPSSHEMRVSQQPSSYIETLRYNWGHSTSGESWELFLERKLMELRNGVDYWAYCMDSGMQRECPEKVDELCDFLMSLGIAPYSMRAKK